MTGVQRESSLSPRPSGPGVAGGRGSAIIEFALILPLLLLFALFTIDYGRLIQHRLICTNVSREGGSVGSRQATIDTALASLLVASGSPLDLGGRDGKVFITRITAGQSAAAPAPTITAQISRGSLAVNSNIGAGRLNLGLTRNLYNHLVFDPANLTSSITDVTVVEVLYKYRPITPLPNFIAGMLLPDGGGLIVGSKAVF